MPISDDDLNYLRNINTRPGPNAGKSIDPTKPGPSDKTDEWDREHAKSRVIIQDEKGRFEAIDRTHSPPQEALNEALQFLALAARKICDVLEKPAAPPRPDPSEHGELDCPTDGVAARQGNGG